MGILRKSKSRKDKDIQPKSKRKEKEYTHTIIGIDNGKKGGIAIITSHKDTIAFAGTFSTPLIGNEFDENSMVSLLQKKVSLDCKAFIEEVRFLPQQSSSAGGNYGMGHGLWRGMLVALGIPYEIVPPQDWQRVMLKGVKKGKPGIKHKMTRRKKSKEASILIAKRLFPDVNLFPSERSRKESDGMAEALLIAEYGRRIYDSRT